MGVQTTWTCDRCGHTQETDDDMFFVSVKFEPLGGYSRSETARKKEMWCRSCCIERGILFPGYVNSKDTAKLPDPEPTIEDMLRDIIREEIDAKDPTP